MALQITDACLNCWACADVCPNDAIALADPHFLIDERKCTECLGDHAEPQCAAICPIEAAIVDELGVYLNPPGSLTGIPVARLVEFGLWKGAA
ncbi:Ferredoxin-like protein in nif region [Candidatus Accumulibacter aalborgensis]|uniref:Ferredoxin-like protein in nif region n=1 Tax=Candidatus Accumulibacter aalborgensis TaxID=1860102 RepID=A0A1A8XS19_9PROT|nr:4Fe-4S binding protein [Candidatus Accumulibacter aalborgensis]SBT07905.1 Ferredoxin-like protein in nif region [Candidatus Accumulibacter aalborgensis]